MGLPSKENKILELFFEYPSKHWQFKEVKNRVKLPDNKTSKWLKKLVKEKIVTRVKPKGKMPFYVGNYNAPEYQNTKRLFGMKMVHESGFLNHLCSLKKADAVILFGSLSRGDWYNESDIDLFIYGEETGLELNRYSKKLGREVQLFVCKNRKDFRKLGNSLIKNIILGDIIKGDLSFLKVKTYV